MVDPELEMYALLQRKILYGTKGLSTVGDFMDRGLSLLVRLMRESWIFIGNPETEKEKTFPSRDSDQEEPLFLPDGTND